ncbi:hypothetical protein [Helicobacter labetoulli]|nr:hypothetical protein [Helicobacter labetoulli]
MDSTLAFKKTLLSHLDNGKMPSPKELGDDAKIVSSKPETTHDDNPPKDV